VTPAAGYILAFRPADYFAVPETILASIKGEARRRAIRDAIERGTVDRLPAAFMRDSLPRPLLAILHAHCPALTAGETLPDCHAGEVEIARVSYPDAVLCDVTSFRARRAGKRITFRAVTDNGDDVALAQTTARLPLTLAGLVRLIERGREGIGFWRSQTACGVRARDLARVTTASAFYPELEPYYAERAARWLRRRGIATAEHATADRLATIRRGLLWRLATEDRQRGIRRTEDDSHAAVDRFIRLRFAL
jgi:hypothetical protein